VDHDAFTQHILHSVPPHNTEYASKDGGQGKVQVRFTIPISNQGEVDYEQLFRIQSMARFVKESHQRLLGADRVSLTAEVVDVNVGKLTCEEGFVKVTHIKHIA
jgi:hypothetical protein